jgi:hypothetical protein
VALTPDLAAPATSRTGGAVAIDVRGAARALVLVPEPGGGHALGRVAVTGDARAVDLTRPSGAIAPGTTVEPVAGQTRVLDGAAVTRWTALGLAATSADLVGTMRGTTKLACDYARDRRQYGRPIGSFQAVQHLLADAFVAAEGSASAALHAAWAVDALAPADAVAAAAVAKAYCARAARTVCETAIQVHGGVGNTWECLAHVYLRRALLASDVLGGAGASLARVLDHHGIGGARGLR